MMSEDITPRELWARQRISAHDVDYDLWNRRRESIRELASLERSCVFTVDVFKERYDFASDNFSELFGYDPSLIRTIRKQGDLLEERVHPDDRAQLRQYQIQHGRFIYSLPPQERNDYRQVFQYRMLNAAGRYVNIISRQQVLQKDSSGKAWIISGVIDISPDQTLSERIKRTVVNLRTGEMLTPDPICPRKELTDREKEVLLLAGRGFLSKEIADRLGVSIFTVNNHRKNILAKLDAGNVIEALNMARDHGII